MEFQSELGRAVFPFLALAVGILTGYLILKKKKE